ncbi:hypothetical protein KY319_01170 [Candidatus Woesearchaeota archaeon]|nr:hypothetical protein [Candidatus Woesearchaeota archaeon]
MTCLKYSPTPVQREELKRVFWEVWQGLPDFPFKESESKGGCMGLKYEKGGTYIWVNPSGYSAYQENPNSVFMVMMQSRSEKGFRARDVSEAKGSLEDAILHAQDLNRSIILEQRDAAKKALKKKKRTEVNNSE